MIDYLFTILKNDAKVSLLMVSMTVALLVILVIKAVFKTTKVKLIIFDTLFWLLIILLLISLFGNVLITKNYESLWNVAFVIVIAVLQKVLPKLVKWYDDKVDKLSERI